MNDDKPQTLLSFEEHDGSKADFVPPSIPRMPPNTFIDLPGAPEQGPLIIILYDMLNMELSDQAYARKALFRYIDGKPSGTRIALFLNTDKTRLIQGFTQDKALLRAALSAPGPGPHIPNMFIFGENCGKGNEGATLSLFKQLARFLEGVPGRKNLLWLSGRFPLHLFVSPDSPIAQEEVKETVAELTRDRIALYPVDVRGVLVDGGGGGGSAAMGAGISNALGQYMGLDALAKATGGQAYYSNNDVGDMLNRATSRGVSYYTLSYSPTNRKENGSERKVKIRIDDSKYSLAYRTSYYLLPIPAMQPRLTSGNEPPDPRSPRLNDSLYAGIQHGNPMQHDLLFSAHVRKDGPPALATPKQMAEVQEGPAFVASRRRVRQLTTPKPVVLQRYRIEYRVIDPDLRLLAEQTGRASMLEFAAAGYNPEGDTLNTVINNALARKLTDRSNAQSKLFYVEQKIDLPLDATWLRIAVRDSLSDRTGSIEVPLPLMPESATPSRH